MNDIEPRYSGGSGVSVQSSTLDIRDYDIGSSIVVYGIITQLSQVFSSNGSGTATLYGLSSNHASIIGKSGDQPYGEKADEYIGTGGVIN